MVEGKSNSVYNMIYVTQVFPLPHSEIHAGILVLVREREDGPALMTVLASGSIITFGPGRSNLSSWFIPLVAAIMFGACISLDGRVIICGIITTERGGKWWESQCREGFPLRGPLQTIPRGLQEQFERNLSGPRGARGMLLLCDPVFTLKLCIVSNMSYIITSPTQGTHKTSQSFESELENKEQAVCFEREQGESSVG